MTNETEAGRMEKRQAHSVSIEGRERISVTSVEDVDSFNENEIIFLTGVGMMTLGGQDLHIRRLNLEEGLLVVEGLIESLDYADLEEERMNGKGRLFGRVFK